MNGQGKTRANQQRIDSLGIPKPRLIQWWLDSDKQDWAIRVTMVLIAALALLVVCQAWRPRFSYHVGDMPARDIIARVSFEIENEAETEQAQLEKLRELPVFYRNLPNQLTQLRAILKSQLLVVGDSSSLQSMSDDQSDAFDAFAGTTIVTPESATEDTATPEQKYQALKAVLAEDTEAEKLDNAFRMMVQEVFENGLLETLKHDPERGSQRFIRVYTADPEDSIEVSVEDVQVARMLPRIKTMLSEEFRSLFGDSVPDQQRAIVVDMVSQWIDERLPQYQTLSYDEPTSEEARAKLAKNVPPSMKRLFAGQTELANAGDTIDPAELALLRHEHQRWQDLRGPVDEAARFLAYAGMLAALSLLCGCYIFFVDDRAILRDKVKLGKLLCLIVLTVGGSYWATTDHYHSELAPLVVGTVIAAIVYGRDLALLLMSACCISVTLFLNEDLAQMVTLAAAATTVALVTGRVRSNSHLLFVGIISAAITALTFIGVGLVTGDTMAIAAAPGSLDLEDQVGTTHFFDILLMLSREGLVAGLFIVVPTTLITPLLPLIEKVFRVHTDLSLMSLSDVSHPLLRRLAQRAPGTYNHSINVASIGEAAADSIGANGLLVRVGAYFHDIGKMFKPEYFIENQSGVNQHDSLQPAMSTLVIIAHVKDGADLARNHHLPQPIIDLIMQHHGTTLVEYFFNEAAKRSEEDPNHEQVSDKDFRYPGPKPQTLEAAVMMLADAVESASRTLVDPTPARIQSLVDKIAQKKMTDGQFDECGLTFRQLRLVRESLAKSLTSIFHARVKYPSQQPA